MTVLAATDLSKGSNAAIRYASMVARARKDTLVLMHGFHMPRDESSWAYFVERAGRVPALEVPATEIGAISVEGFALTPEQRLAAFVVLGVLVSVVGIRVATHFSGVDIEDVEDQSIEQS